MLLFAFHPAVASDAALPRTGRAAGAERGPDAPGTEQVWATFFRTHHPHLRNYGLRIVPRPQAVDDAIQEVMLALWRSDTDPATLDHPRAYLLTALRRTLLSGQEAARRRRARREALRQEAVAFELSREDLIVSQELRAEQQARLRDALDGLSVRRREALYLKFYHGLTYDEVAGVMDVRNQSARNYVSEALHTLRDVLTA